MYMQVTPDNRWGDVAKELADVIVTAMVALETP